MTTDDLITQLREAVVRLKAANDKLRAEDLTGEIAERMESLLIATAPGLTTHLDHEVDEARALLARIKEKRI